MTAKKKLPESPLDTLEREQPGQVHELVRLPVGKGRWSKNPRSYLVTCQLEGLPRDHYLWADWYFSGLLKPCPFCGDRGQNWQELGIFQCGEFHDTETWYFFVECGICNVQGPTRKYQDYAIRAWNKRR